MEITTIIAIYGALLSTFTLIYSIYSKKDKLKFSYSRVDINNKYYWAFEVVNASKRNIYLKHFWFLGKDGTRFVLGNCEDVDSIDISSVITLEPDRSIEVYYAEEYIKMNDTDVRSFFAEEENGKRYYLDKKRYTRLQKKGSISNYKKFKYFFIRLLRNKEEA